MDPEQVEIMNDPDPWQIIIGPASTGKTLLIQLKVLDILTYDPNSNILILVPLEIMKATYQKFFQQQIDPSGSQSR